MMIERQHSCSSGPGAAPLAAALGFPRAPLVDDGIPVVDAETPGRITDPGIGWQN
jgi:hypothetical protein